MINLSRKLYISLLTLVLLFVVAGTVTFAWFKLNTNAWFSDMELGAASGDDLMISVDGENYKRQLTSTDVAASIVAYMKGWDLRSAGENKDEWLTEKGEVIEVTDDSVAEYFKLTLKPLTTLDGENFQNRATIFKLSSKAYVRFKIYFKSETKSPQDVYFSTGTFTYDDGTYIPKTQIRTVGQSNYGFPEDIRHDFSSYDLTNGKMINYNHQNGTATYDDVDKTDVTESFKQNYRAYISDAARFAVTTSSDSNPRFYELNKGNGSYATKLAAGTDYIVRDNATGAEAAAQAAAAAYDYTKNAGVSYYNQVRKDEAEKADDGVGVGADGIIEESEIMSYNDIPSTFKGFDTVEAAKILSLNASNEYGDNGKASMTLTLWIEGWDADCIDFVLDQQLVFDMQFTTKHYEEDPLELTYLVKNPNTNYITKRIVRHQILNMLISDDSPAYITNNSHAFKGWAWSDENGNYLDNEGKTSDVPTLFDFTNTIVTPSAKGEKWYLVSVWE